MMDLASVTRLIDSKIKPRLSALLVRIESINYRKEEYEILRLQLEKEAEEDANARVTLVDLGEGFHVKAEVSVHLMSCHFQ